MQNAINSAVKLHLSFIPDDAYVLRRMFEENREMAALQGISQIPWSVVGPRIRAFTTIPVTIFDAASYGIKGICLASAKIAELKFDDALEAFAENVIKTFQCLALVVANLAYATLGLLFGAEIFTRYIADEGEALGVLSEAQQIGQVINIEIANLQGLVEKLKKPPENEQAEGSKEEEDQLDEMSLLIKKLEDAEKEHQRFSKEVDSIRTEKQNEIDILREALTAREEVLQEKKSQIERLSKTLEAKEKELNTSRKQQTNFEALKNALNAKINSSQVLPKTKGSLRGRGQGKENLNPVKIAQKGLTVPVSLSDKENQPLNIPSVSKRVPLKQRDVILQSSLKIPNFEELLKEKEEEIAKLQALLNERNEEKIEECKKLRELKTHVSSLAEIIMNERMGKNASQSLFPQPSMATNITSKEYMNV